MRENNMLPVAPSLEETLNAGMGEAVKSPVSGRVFLLSLQAFFHARVIAVIAH